MVPAVPGHSRLTPDFLTLSYPATIDLTPVSEAEE